MRLPVILSILLVLALSGCGNKNTGPEKAAESFLRAVATQDIETAKSLAAGKVLYNLSSKEKQGVKFLSAEVRAMSTKVKASSQEWAKVYTSAKVALENGEVDFTWYHLELIKSEGVWKVYRADLIGPDIEGSGQANAGNVEQAKAVFSEYLHSLVAGEHTQSIKYLAGPARRSQEMSAALMSSVPVFQTVGEIRMTPLMQKDDLLICEAYYPVDGRNVKVVVTFAGFDGVWKITEISEA